MFPKEWAAECVLPVLEAGKQVSNAEHDYGGSYPKDFYEALIRPDWRQWVEAVKSDNDSWLAFQASDVVDYTHVELGASVIPLGELFTIKRMGSLNLDR